LVAIGEGAKARVEEAFRLMGSNLARGPVLAPPARPGRTAGFGSMPTLTWDDLKAIRSEAARFATPVPQLAQQSASDQ